MFLDGRESAEFEPHGGKPKTVCTVTNINVVLTAIQDNHHQSPRILATELKISWESIRRILRLSAHL